MAGAAMKAPHRIMEVACERPPPANWQGPHVWS